MVGRAKQIKVDGSEIVNIEQAVVIRRRWYFDERRSYRLLRRHNRQYDFGASMDKGHFRSRIPAYNRLADRHFRTQHLPSDDFFANGHGRLVFLPHGLSGKEKNG